MKTSLLAVCMFVFVANEIFVLADTTLARTLIEKSKYAYLKYDFAQLSALRNEFKKMDKTILSEAEYFKVMLGYKLLEMNLHNEKAFDSLYDEILADTELLIKREDFKDEGLVLKAAIYMMKIAIEPMSAVSLSTQIHQLLSEA